MAIGKLLSDKFEILLEMEQIDATEIPCYVKDNINPKFDLRQYQIESHNSLEFYCDNYKKKQIPINLLFNLATGAGKTLLMASNMLYLYNKGYRSFIFFVNSTNIIEKTKYNFLVNTSNKYLFNDKIFINNKMIEVREINNLGEADDTSINILFTTIQGLHYQLNTPTEGALTYEDFKDRKVILLSDEAHHLNTLTKNKLSKGEEEEKNSWEYTINKILYYNNENMLLEYTATAELENLNVYEKYKDKVIYKYDLSSFRKDKFSKEVTVLQSDSNTKDRILQVVILSEYRRKVAEKNGIPLKPVILIKSNRIDQSKETVINFNNWIKNLTVEELNRLNKKEEDSVITKAFKFFESEAITLHNLIVEIKYNFNEDKCIEVNNKEESEQKQIIVNTLEDRENWYRVVFAVDMLNEGWDVLNLFDIVRVEEGRGSKATTTKEAQLIGRGARYFPFTLGSEDKFKRKFDENLNNEIRIIEELYYHCINEPKYISDLRKELKEKGLLDDEANMKTVVLKLKDSFKDSNVFKNGFILGNKKVINTNANIVNLKQMGVAESYNYTLKSGSIRETHILDDIQEETKSNNLNRKTYKLLELGKNIIQKAISTNYFYKFSNIIKYYPNIESINKFINSNDYLGGLEVTLISEYNNLSEIKNDDLLQCVLDVLKEIEGKIKRNYVPYKGTKEFFIMPLKDLQFEKKMTFTLGGEDKEAGKSMSEENGSKLRLNLVNEKWYAYEDNFGTSEEKELVLYMKEVYNDLKTNGFEDIYLIRNEKILKLYHFDDDRVCEPDFLLWAKKKEDSEYKYYQLFIEPKGDQLLEKDKWKEDLLMRIQSEYKAVLIRPKDVIKETSAVYEIEETLIAPKEISYDIENSVIIENDKYRLIGLSFYNKGKEKEFKKEFRDKLAL